MSSFYGIQIAKTGLSVSQQQLNVTAHNISNVDTTGYTRQRVNTSAIVPSSTNVMFASRELNVGQGVSADGVEQVRSEFLDYQYRDQNSTTSKWSTKNQYFSYVEDLFNTELDDSDSSGGTGITSVLGDFYTSLDSLNASPADATARANVQQNALKLTETVNDYYNSLLSQQKALNVNVKTTVDQINSCASQIADLNQQIDAYELSGEKANDLRDQRNQALDQLSSLIQINYSEDNSGNVNVQVGGRNLVMGSTANKMAVDATLANPIQAGASNNLYQVYWADSSGNPTPIKVDITSGSLSGYLDVRDGNDTNTQGIPYIVGQLNNFCQSITKQVNAIHAKGYTMPDATNGNVSQTGINFFKDTSTAQDASLVTAANFSVSDEVKASIYNIAASDTKVTVDSSGNMQQGNGNIALQLSKLVDQTDSAGNDTSFSGVFRTIVTGVGIEMNHIQNTSDTQTVLQSHLSDQRQSVSGVSLDEEMTNMIQFQHAYAAASRVITAMDEQLNTLINSTGLVGRT
jgi:flagellar hook-associated protein FlgK